MDLCESFKVFLRSEEIYFEEYYNEKTNSVCIIFDYDVEHYKKIFIEVSFPQKINLIHAEIHNIVKISDVCKKDELCRILNDINLKMAYWMFYVAEDGTVSARYMLYVENTDNYHWNNLWHPIWFVLYDISDEGLMKNLLQLRWS